MGPAADRAETHLGYPFPVAWRSLRTTGVQGKGANREFAGPCER
jgi:hypothetical protein